MKDIEEDNLKDIAEIQIRIRLTVGAVFESLKVEYNDISPHMLILIYSGILSETLGRFSVYFTAEEQETLKKFLLSRYDAGVQVEHEAHKHEVSEQPHEKVSSPNWEELLKNTKPMGSA